MSSKIQAFLPWILVVGGAVLLLADLSSGTIHMRGADSIAGAILMSSGVVALVLQERSSRR